MSVLSAAPPVPTQAPVELRGGAVGALILRTTAAATAHVEESTQALRALIRKTPGFYPGAPAAIDMALAPEEREGFDIAAAAEIARRCGLIPIGVVGAESAQAREAYRIGLALCQPARGGMAGRPAAADALVPPPDPEPVAAPAPDPLESRSARILTENIRSGQRLYARGGDLVVLGSIGHGAEIAADGCVHVYGALRGRVIAGAAGDASARIFCQALDAELVAIAGLYQVADRFDPALVGRAAQIYAEGDNLLFKPLF